MSDRPLYVAWDNALAGRSRTGTGVYASQLIRELSGLPELRFEVFHGWNVIRGSNRFPARGIRGLSSLLWNHCTSRTASVGEALTCCMLRHLLCRRLVPAPAWLPYTTFRSVYFRSILNPGGLTT